MESSAERFEQIELSNDLQYECLDCLDTKKCPMFGVCSKCHVPIKIAKPNPNDKIKEFNEENGIQRMDPSDPEVAELQRKYDEARNKNFSHRKSEKTKASGENPFFHLSPFYIENDEGSQLCQVSTTRQDGWHPISIMMDSGACDCVAPPGTFPGIPIMQKTASRDGLEYTAAGGHRIPNLGMCRPVVFTMDGERNAMAFQMAAISKTTGCCEQI